MPFVQMIKERCEKLGIETALRQALDFDEDSALSVNKNYLLNNLDLERIEIKCSDDATDEKTKEECVPGEPFIVFSVGSSKRIYLSNPQPSSGCLSGSVNVLDEDFVKQIKNRMVSAKIVKSTNVLELFRYSDPVMGPRKIPEPNLLGKGRTVQLNDNDQIKFSDGNMHVKTVVNGLESTVLLGDQILYFVDVTQ